MIDICSPSSDQIRFSSIDSVFGRRKRGGASSHFEGSPSSYCDRGGGIPQPSRERICNKHNSEPWERNREQKSDTKSNIHATEWNILTRIFDSRLHRSISRTKSWESHTFTICTNTPIPHTFVLPSLQYDTIHAYVRTFVISAPNLSTWCIIYSRDNDWTPDGDRIAKLFFTADSQDFFSPDDRDGDWENMNRIAAVGSGIEFPSNMVLVVRQREDIQPTLHAVFPWYRVVHLRNHYHAGRPMMTL